MATSLGNSIGTFINVDFDENDNCWKPSLCIRITIDITNPLGHGLKFGYENSSSKDWIQIKYERVPDFCYDCDMIGHILKNCALASSKMIVLQRKTNIDLGSDFNLPRGISSRKNQERSATQSPKSVKTNPSDSPSFSMAEVI
ncbi:uncharacterized protein LOC120082783 [Benincasa hispida]|uniref:uncharacterized protein LOC120082783 n=1 Tax=Benincasa hispida TaxID=102211 RepID=UPI00190290B2|nr:uncharacterized protein LOC120082783 [Benincasa hispida]